MRNSQDDIGDGDKNDVINEEDTLNDANIFLHNVMALINASVKINNITTKYLKLWWKLSSSKRNLKSCHIKCFFDQLMNLGRSWGRGVLQNWFGL